MNRFTPFILAIAGAVAPAIVSCGRDAAEVDSSAPLTSAWMPDTTLGNGFEMRYVDQGRDYSGPVRSTIIRKLTADSCASRRGVLYVHGFNDYFFQADMADRFVVSCYSFYAVDLRKYGRSIIKGQSLFQVRDMKEYFPDIDSALVQMQTDGINEVVLMGHSTGGLTTSLYMNNHPDKVVKVLVLNSPFLDWNQSPLQERVLVPIVDFVGRWLPGIKISQGESHVYSNSLLKGRGGEWRYNTDWKLIQSPDVTTGWIRAIDLAQNWLQKYSDIDVPVLLMHSDSTYRDSDPLSKSHSSDAVLDVTDISRYGRRLGPQVTEVIVKGGLHDLALSRKGVRNAMFDYMFYWLGKELPSE